jgi:hypothetical protein
MQVVIDCSDMKQNRQRSPVTPGYRAQTIYNWHSLRQSGSSVCGETGLLVDLVKAACGGDEAARGIDGLMLPIPDALQPFLKRTVARGTKGF